MLGFIIDGESRGPIEGVAVTLRPLPDTANAQPDPARSQTVLTDENGRFVFDDRGLVDGPYEIAVERIGYASIVDSLVFRSSLGLRIEGELVPTALELSPLLVVAEARSQALETRGFYRRRAQGLGRFLSPEEVRSLQAFQVSDLFRLMPGVAVSAGGQVSGQRFLTLRGGCVPTVYLDGVRTIPPFPLDAVLHPQEVDAVEVYQTSEVPAQFGPTSCGAVVIWTHIPNTGAGSPFTWRRVLPAVGFIGAVLLLTR